MSLLCSVVALLVVAAPEPMVSSKMVGTMGNVFQMNGSFEVAAPEDVAWGVLTDYASHPKFVSDLRSSVITERKPDGALVKQEATGKVAMFSATVQLHLRMKETPGAQITFADVLGKDFEMFEGKWSLSSTAKGVRVNYEMRCTPRARAPGFIMGPVMEDSTRRLMAQMRGEIEKRAVVVVAGR